MTAVRVGALLAAVVAGPPLYALVQDGVLDADAGLVRYAVVAVACAAGAAGIGSLVRGYEADARRRRHEALVEETLQALRAGQPPPAS